MNISRVNSVKILIAAAMSLSAMSTMPALTTNVEFGLLAQSGKLVQAVSAIGSVQM